MDASSTPASSDDTNVEKLFNYFIQSQNSILPVSVKQRNSAIKYTKLPDFDFDTKVSWPKASYTLSPKLRRIVEVEDSNQISTRSQKVEASSTNNTCRVNKITRKIVTILEDKEDDCRSISNSKRPVSRRTLNKAVGENAKEGTKAMKKDSVRMQYSHKYSKETIPCAKSYAVNNNKEVNASQKTYKGKCLNTLENIKNTYGKENDSKQYIQIANNSQQRTNFKKKNIVLSRNEKQTVYNSKRALSPKTIEKHQIKKSVTHQGKSKLSFWDEIRFKNNPVTIIHAPLEKEVFSADLDDEETLQSFLKTHMSDDTNTKSDCTTETKQIEVNSKDIYVNMLPSKVDKNTDTEFNQICTTYKINDIRKELDCLEIPNVTLTKEVPKENIVDYCSKSLPNLNMPSFKINTQTENKSAIDSKIRKGASLIIGRATLTYTTRQKINFHVLSSNDEATPSLAPSPLAYPMNVVSVFKSKIKTLESSSEISTTNNEYEFKQNSNISNTNYHNNSLNLNCARLINKNKLVKPSDIISTLRVNGSLLKNDHICEQFQRELNFVDSFFESLQYLDSCSLSEKCFVDNKCQGWISQFDIKNTDYRSFISNIENDMVNEGSKTMVSKSLCLLNLLIRDEQRRAKNLLLVLKMREDALKDFTKSHIMWLENKKKQDNTDISTLKKKQRGALLKLQFECGEMQRMRKALLTLSEKRKTALMKTKRNIELKLKNTVDVDHLLLGKRKPKKTISTDRNLTPLKCFDLSSSGCDENIVWKLKTDRVETSVELRTSDQCVQTGDSILENGRDKSDVSKNCDDNCIIVDGAYLNILFHNLSLPQIFNQSNQYEVNEEALKKIVNSANLHVKLSDTEVLDQFTDLIKNPDQDNSTSPSTARSLVEELDQYYKDFTDDNNQSPLYVPDSHYNSPTLFEIKDQDIQVSEMNLSNGSECTEPVTIDSSDNMFVQLKITESNECQTVKGSEVLEVASQTRALSDSGEYTKVEELFVDFSLDQPVAITSVSSTPDSSDSAPGVSSVTPLANCEAEELRRQQLAIEREIKALEQQQNQLLVVREIPDKPPPPYTPPTDNRAPKSARRFQADADALDKLNKHIIHCDDVYIDPTDALDIFLKDFSVEILERQKMDISDNPWDACNLLPQKPDMELKKISRKANNDLKELFGGVTQTVVTGVSNRRSDHIDDILFTEWKRCEPEWTALHVDEAVVKNQIFESIFQRVLTETMDQYKQHVLGIRSDLSNI